MTAAACLVQLNLFTLNSSASHDNVNRYVKSWYRGQTFSLPGSTDISSAKKS